MKLNILGGQKGKPLYIYLHSKWRNYIKKNVMIKIPKEPQCECSYLRILNVKIMTSLLNIKTCCEILHFFC